MVVTSLKSMDEIRLGDDPGAAARADASAVDQGVVVGLHRPATATASASASVNSVKILVPSVIVSIAVGSLTGYALSFWRVRGAGLLFGTLMVVAFVPYQIFIYPLVRVFSFVGLNNSMPGIVVDPHHLRPADDDAAVPQLFRLAAARAVQGGARRRRRLLSHLLVGDAADGDADA